MPDHFKDVTSPLLVTKFERLIKTENDFKM
jgi:hypothetical protein